MTDRPKIDGLLAAPLPGRARTITREQAASDTAGLAVFAAWTKQVAG